MPVKRVRALAMLLALGAVAGCQGALAPREPGAAGPSDAALVARGAQLAAVGNCRSCHTTPDGPPFAGGVPMRSPFGTIYSTNITPHPEAGIGRWSEAAFIRAMREGVRADGAHLYPAFPYDRFTRVTDEDNRALYAYLMSQPPVDHRPPAHELRFPFNVRAGIAVWKKLYFRPGAWPTEPSPPALLARGEYLVEGLGHCGSCHSPRNRLFAEDLERAYSGGEAEGWHAYAINARNAAPVPWDADALAQYLRHGFHPKHGIARGTMGWVTEELAQAAPDDVRAMAAYVAKLMEGRAPLARDRARPAAPEGGALLFRTACLECHDGTAPLPFGGLDLELSIGVHGESPRNLVNVILHGLPPAGGEAAPMMPGYAGSLSDAQVETLVTWMRATLTDRPAWQDVARHIRASRAMDASMLRYPPGGAGTDPARIPEPPR